jgi:16S rRNA G966 N2-methylase RsmD
MDLRLAHHFSGTRTSNRKWDTPVADLFAGVSRNQIKHGEEKMMSTKEDARQTTAIMKQYCAKHHDKNVGALTIADAFACLGGNTFSFAENFRKVTAYEIDQERFEALEKNVSNYPAQKKKHNVAVKWQNCCDEGGILDTNYDVVFLDPPWINPKTNIDDGSVFGYTLNLCNQMAEARMAKYIFIGLPIQALDKKNETISLRNKLHEFLEHLSVKWDDVQHKPIYRTYKHDGKKEVYNIVCARRKDMPVTRKHRTRTPRTKQNAKLSALLAQLRACNV